MLSLAAGYAHADVDPRRYEQEIRREAHMDDEWFTCETDKDCTLAHIPCQASIAVAKKFKAAAEGAVCRVENCYAICRGTTADHSTFSCSDDGECVTSFDHADAKRK